MWAQTKHLEGRDNCRLFLFIFLISLITTYMVFQFADASCHNDALIEKKNAQSCLWGGAHFKSVPISCKYVHFR